MKRTSLLLTLCIASIFILSSCAKRETIRQPIPKDIQIEGRVSSSTLLNRLIFRQVSSLKSEVNIEVLRNNEPVGSFGGILVYKSPGQIGARIFGPLGVTVGDMIFSGDLIQVYIPMKNIIFEGKSHGPEHLKALISNEPASDIRFSIEETGDSYFLSAFKSRDGELEQTARMTFDNISLINNGIDIFSNRKSIARAKMSEYSGNPAIPYFISTDFEGGVAVNIRLVEPEINADVPDDFFVPRRHEGNDVRPLKDIKRLLDKLK